MSDSKDKKAEDELKVIEEEEVVRLDDSGKKSLKKSDRMPVEALGGLGSSEEEVRDDLPAEEEAKEAEFEDVDEEVAAVPMGWFYLLGAILVGVIIWMSVQIAFKETEADAGDADGNVAEYDPMADFQSRQAAQQHFEAMEKMLKGFLSADSIEERVKFVRHPERVLPLMKNYYKDRELRTFRFVKVKSYMTASLSSRPFIALAVVTEEQKELPVLIEDLTEGMFVDWESFVCYQPLSPERYLETKPKEEVTMRAYAQVDNFFAYEFSDEREYACYRLEFRGSDTFLYGYVKRGTAVDQKFTEVFGPSGFRIKKPLILSLRFLEGSRADRSVLIEDLESVLWAYAENPDQE